MDLMSYTVWDGSTGCSDCHPQAPAAVVVEDCNTNPTLKPAAAAESTESTAFLSEFSTESFVVLKQAALLLKKVKVVLLLLKEAALLKKAVVAVE